MEEKKSRILLESGTNEIEVMRFTVSGELYGINVAKVQEIIMAEKVKPMRMPIRPLRASLSPGKL